MKHFKITTISLVIFLCLGCNGFSQGNGEYDVYAVRDGDTIALTNSKDVRYIGIDTPETRKRVKGKWVWDPQPYAIKASDFNKSLVEGRKVKLEFDIEEQDRYGRWLCYVFVDGKMVNEELVRAGYAVVYTRHPNTKYRQRLLSAEKEAQNNKRGLWAKRKK